MKKTAIVTGGSGGIGKATAIALAKEGYDLLITYLSRKTSAEDTCRQVESVGKRCVAVKADISDLNDIAELYRVCEAEFGAPDLVVNNSAWEKMVPFLDTTPEVFDNTVNVNLRGTFFCAQAGARMMKESGKGGLIINISSVQADGCWPNYSCYSASKAGLTKLTKNIALELARYGIRAVAVHPGYIDVGLDYDTDKGLEQGIPMKRFGKAEEVANLIAFLASDKAAYATGSVFNVDGGILLPNCAENNLSEY